MREILEKIIQTEMCIGVAATFPGRVVDRLLPMFEGQKKTIEQLVPENELLQSMLEEKTALQNRMYEALMAVWHQIEEGKLVSMDPSNIRDFVFVMNIVQAAIIQAQGGHRGTEKKNEL